MVGWGPPFWHGGTWILVGALQFVLSQDVQNRGKWGLYQLSEFLLIQRAESFRSFLMHDFIKWRDN